jgi:TRAP-type mannitol/chloroaromatic compound transport system permease small subunit
MRAFSQIVGALGTALLVLSAIAVLLSMVVGTVDVIGTQLFLSPLHGATESITELMVILVFLALPHVQRARANIRVELLYSHFGARTRSALDAVAAIAGFAFFGLVFWQGIEAATFSWRINESTMSFVRIPIYPAKFSILVGAGLMILQLVVDMVESMRAAIASADRA